MDDTLAQQLLSASPDGLWLLDLDGSTRWANDRLGALLGSDTAPVSAESLFDLHDDQGRLDLAGHLAEMQAHHPGRENDEVLLVRPDGSRVWTLVSWAPAYDDQGVLLGYLHRFTEYTQRRALVQRLSEREAELETAQSIAKLGSWTWDVGTDRLTWSDELLRIHGATPEDFDGTYAAFAAFIHPEDRARIEGTVEECMRSGHDYEFQHRIVTPAGETRWVNGRGVVDRDEHGSPTRLHGTCQDVTDLRAASDSAEEATRRLRLLREMADAANRSDTLAEALARAGSALDSMSSWRSVGIWVDAGPGTELHLLHDRTAPGDAVRPDRAQAAASWATGDLRVNVDGSCFSLPIQAQGRVLCVAQVDCGSDPPDEMTHDLLLQVAGQLGRVAERELAAQDLAAARDDAMAASAHKSAFLATMSHEIRTPMNGVIGLNDLLLHTDLDGHQRRLAEGLRGAGLTLLALINDILDLSKIEAGAIEIEHAPFEVAQVLEQTATIISPPAQEKRLELVLSCHPAVPHTLLGDRVRLNQVITNLASNAVKFTEHGEVVVELQLEEGAEPGRALLRGEVRDTGIGIGADASTLFEAFTQADHSTTRSHGGTGLGLTISRRLVHDMGGSIGADERAEGGSTFWFVVPVGVPAQQAGAPHRPQLEPCRILVVDDNDAAAAALARQLTAWGHEVRTASSASAALPLLAESAGTAGAFDLVFVDLHMPETDGLELGHLIKARQELARLRLILLSDDPSIRQDHVTDSGFLATVNKPLRLSELQDSIRSATLDTGELLLVGPSDNDGDDEKAFLDLNVLVVDDNPVNQLVAQGLLERVGCVTTVAANGEEAVAALRPGHPFDLVLMDCRMPRMDGYVATETIRARETDTRIPIIAMTASALEGERDRCLAAGMDDFLTKPVDSATLTRLITRWSPTSAHRAGPSSSPPGSGDGPATPTPLPAEAPTLDPDRVEMLSELVRDGVNFFERTRSSFLARIDDNLTALRRALDAHDLDEVAAVAHQLKGSALNLGLTRAGNAAAQVEGLAAADDVPGTGVAIDLLSRAVTEGIEALARA